MKKLSKKIIAVVLSISVVFAIAGITASASASTMSDVVVFVKFADDTTDELNSGKTWNKVKSYYNDTTNLYTQYGIEEDVSFKNYINLISRGAVNIENYFPQDNGDTVNVLTLKNNYGYYTDDYYIIREVMDAFNNNTLALPSGKIDNVNVGVMDCLTIIVQTNHYDHPSDDVIYPHKSYTGSTELVKNKYIVSGYIIMDSYSVTDSQGTGVIAHEYMHIMGFPDLYRGSGSGNPVGLWDIMAAVGNYKQYPLSYMRAIQNWVPLNEAYTTGTYTLDAATLNTDNAVLKLKTPMSDSEFFCVEYRKKKTENVVAGIGIETKIPSSGLLVYRVNDTVDNHSNFEGNDYLYIFRPEETSTTASGGSIYGAAINPAEGETSYGSADFSAEITDNTIFYSSGKNSGIVIDNLTVSADGNSVTFDITYPDYSSLNLWDKVGNPFGSSISGDVDMDIDANGNIYAVSLTESNFSYYAQAFKWDGTSWSAFGSKYRTYDARIKVFNGTPYMVYINDNTGVPTVLKYTNNNWTVVKAISNAAYPSSINFVSDSDHLYLTYISDGTKIVINEVTSSTVTEIDSSITTTGMFGNFCVASYNNKLYAMYSVMGWGSSITDKTTHIKEFNSTTKKWTDVQTLNLNSANIHTMSVKDGKLFAVSAVSGSNPIYATFDGTTWNQETIPLTNTSISGLKVSAAGGKPYIACINNDTVSVWYKAESGWEKVGDVTSDTSYFDFDFLGGRAYVATVSNSGATMSVFSKLLYVEPISITSQSSKVAVGQTIKLTAIGGTGSYTWKAQDTKALSVDSNGNVKGISQGGSNVTVYDDSGNSAVYFIKVTPNNGKLVTYVAGGRQYQKVDWWKKYSSAKIKLAYEEYNCENAVRYKWTSSNVFVIVDQQGNVTYNGFLGACATVTVSAYDADGNVIAKSSIKVGFYKLDSQLKRFK